MNATATLTRRNKSEEFVAEMPPAVPQATHVAESGTSDPTRQNQVELTTYDSKGRCRVKLSFSFAAGNVSAPVDETGEERTEMFLETVYLLSSDPAAARQAIDVIFQKINRLLLNDGFSACDHILTKIDVTRLTSTLLVAFLSITFAAKGFLVARPAFYAKVYAHLKAQRGQEKTDRLLAKYQ